MPVFLRPYVRLKCAIPLHWTLFEVKTILAATWQNLYQHTNKQTVLQGFDDGRLYPAAISIHWRAIQDAEQLQDTTTARAKSESQKCCYAAANSNSPMCRMLSQHLWMIWPCVTATSATLRLQQAVWQKCSMLTCAWHQRWSANPDGKAVAADAEHLQTC